MNNKNIIYSLLLLGIISRFLPHPHNFAPIGGIAIFSGLYLPKKWSISIPLAAMFISDLFIGFYDWKIILSVYISFALMAGIGLMIRQNKTLVTVIGGTLLGSILFYIITNFTVWAFGTMYAHDLAGLFHCYYMAIPFFRNSALGDMFYTGIFVGAYEFISSFYAQGQSVKLSQKI